MEAILTGVKNLLTADEIVIVDKLEVTSSADKIMYIVKHLTEKSTELIKRVVEKLARFTTRGEKEAINKFTTPLEEAKIDILLQQLPKAIEFILNTMDGKVHGYESDKQKLEDELKNAQGLLTYGWDANRILTEASKTLSDKNTNLNNALKNEKQLNAELQKKVKDTEEAEIKTPAKENPLFVQKREIETYHQKTLDSIEKMVLKILRENNEMLLTAMSGLYTKLVSVNRKSMPNKLIRDAEPVVCYAPSKNTRLFIPYTRNHPVNAQQLVHEITHKKNLCLGWYFCWNGDSDPLKMAYHLNELGIGERLTILCCDEHKKELDKNQDLTMFSLEKYPFEEQINLTRNQNRNYYVCTYENLS